jgi:probable F420-dependent oxidoreductase
VSTQGAGPVPAEMVASNQPERPRPFRFGVGPGAIAIGSAGAWRDFARRIEDLGYSTLSVGDHLVGGHGPVAAIAVAADATTRLRVGALTFGNDYRHPVVLAQETATLDLLSDGRLELGIGAGWMRADYERAGIALDPAGERIERLAEAITVLKGCFSGDPLTFAGKHYRIDGHIGRPLPVQRPHPPILVGGAGRKVLALAAREADIVGLNVNLGAGHLGPEMGPSATRAATEAKVALVGAQAAGRAAPPELQVYVHAVAIGPGPAGVEGIEAAARSLGVTPGEAAESPHVLAGSVDAVVEALEERRERLGISYVSVGADAAESLAPVVARLAGK